MASELNVQKDALGDGDFHNINQAPPLYHIRFRYKDRLEWATLYSAMYEHIKCTAYQTFPGLLGQEIAFYDTEGAMIRAPFIESFLKFSATGVILNIVTGIDQIYNLGTASSPGPSSPAPSSSHFSTYSKAYTGGTSGCSTDTIHDLSCNSNTSSTNFDDSDNESLSSCRIPKKKLKTAAVNYHKITDAVLKNYILSHPGGREIVAFYREHKTLDDQRRKKLVNILVEHMFQYMPPDLLPSHETKTDYARTVINLFPKVKDPNSKAGFEAFYDPLTKKGWLSTRIRNLARDNTNVKVASKNSTSQTKDEEENHDFMEDDISFLKFATPDQREEIFKKTEETFAIRNNKRENLATLFPRFLDTEGLIALEFHLMYPTTAENSFVDIFPKYVVAIRNVYKVTVTKPDPTLVKDSVESSDEWDSNTKAIIILAHLLPPTSSKKAKKESAANAINKLIVFQFTQVPLQTILESRPSKQPFILAVGTSRAAVSSYYIVFDNHIIPSPKADILTAFDCLFQIYFVFDLHFDQALQYFFQFVQIQFYKINVENIPLTSRMRDIRTKIVNQLEDDLKNVKV